jgi:hypothetical protein
MIPKEVDSHLLAYPSDLRPISLTNTDAKIWAALLNHMLVPLIADMITPVQKGFVKHRNGGEHIIEADYYGLEFARRFPQPAYFVLGYEGRLSKCCTCIRP